MALSLESNFSVTDIQIKIFQNRKDVLSSFRRISPRNHKSPLLNGCNEIQNSKIINPLKHGGRCTPPPLPFFLPVTHNYHKAPIPENS